MVGKSKVKAFQMIEAFAMGLVGILIQSSPERGKQYLDFITLLCSGNTNANRFNRK
jgi:hypothetical protein